MGSIVLVKGNGEQAFERMGLTHPLRIAYQSTRERARFSDYKVPVFDKSTAFFFFFWFACRGGLGTGGSQIVIRNQVAGI